MSRCSLCSDIVQFGRKKTLSFCFYYLCFLLLTFYFTGNTSITVLQKESARLPCPHKKGDISWSRFINGKKVILVSIKNGREIRDDKRFGYLADNSLFIMKVTSSDSGMYFCNQSRIYLQVTTDPSMVTPATPRHGGQGPDFGLGQEGDAADTENQQSSGFFWKVLVGVTAGITLALLSAFTLTICSRKTRATNTDDKTVAEVIYEEIGAGEEQPRGGSDTESPYYWISQTPSPSSPPDTNLYNVDNKLETNGRSCEQHVYYLAQIPAQAGNTRE